MPLSAEQRAEYGPDWRVVVAEVRERAGYRCECRGECGSPACAKERRADRCPRRHRSPISNYITARPGSVYRVVLTTAHLCHVRRCRERSHLRALCQRCHLSYNRLEHARNAAATRDAGQGQGRLPLQDTQAVAHD